jgi:hypothetical protein
MGAAQQRVNDAGARREKAKDMDIGEACEPGAV